MSFKSHEENSRWRLRSFAVFGLIIILCATEANAIIAQTNRSAYLDFTGDGKTDWAVYTPPSASGQSFRLKILGNQTSSAPSQPLIRIFDFGLSSDILFFGDYVGDRKTDLVAWRRVQPNNIFYVAQFPIDTGNWTLERAVLWGAAETDGTAPGDYDGDGKIDYTAVRRTASGLTWFILSSSANTMRAVNFGSSAISFGTMPGADFTGDGRDELIVTANVNGTLTYYIGDAVTGTWLFTRQWGFSDLFIDRTLQPADYTGDGKADLVAVRRIGVNLIWYILDPATNTATAILWGFGRESAGNPEDTPVSGDYDGDGRQDIAVYRSSNGTFYVLKSSDSGFIVQQWGEAGDSPLRDLTFRILV